MSTANKKTALVLWFDSVRNEDVGLVGGKNASLGEMYQQLTAKGIRIPNGFAVTAYAYRYFLTQSGIRSLLENAMKGLNKENVKDLETRGSKVRSIILGASFPEDLKEAIAKAYTEMEKQYNSDVDVAVRSSATAEDLPDASFAGQQETYLNIKGIENVLLSCKRCMASLFTNRAISYREDKGFDHFSVALSVGIQKMVRSDLASSGVMFSADSETGFRDVALITGSWGLGENIVQGMVNPDEFVVFKPTLKTGHSPIVRRKLGSKEMKMIYSCEGTIATKNVHTPIEDAQRFCLNDQEVLQLARWAIAIEDHYTQQKGKYMPMDIEWAKDGISNDLYIVQARPETVHSQKDWTKLKQFRLKEHQAKVLIKGSSVGNAIGTGKPHVIKDITGLGAFRPGEVLVTTMTDPDWEPILKRAAAVVTNRGGRTCHAAIISRELGIPCVVGCGNATELLSPFEGKEITVDCSSGEEGRVLEGKIPFEVAVTDLKTVPQLKTKIMMNLADPEQALKQSFLPNQGVGLLRMEFIISNHIHAHPMALLSPSSPLVSSSDREKLSRLTQGYSSGKDYFIQRLAEGIGMISAAFYPKPVILRFSDFKTDEYAGLVGGKGFEPPEANPMIGWRGASRYYDPKYREAFALECAAVIRVRKDFGLTNLQVMIPFCRTIEEAKLCIKEMANSGLSQKDGLKVIGMCEIPSNVILAQEFLEVFDGFSIGSNDLTQLTLGVDRNSETIAKLFDERNPAVTRLISQVIQVAKKMKKYIGICGQAPSDYPEFAAFLVEEGIESISLNPDTVLSTTLRLAETEKKLTSH